MLLGALVNVIETLKERINAHGATLRQNETRTRMALIDPLLAALGWDTSDPELVTPEFISNGRADYALLKPGGKPLALVEAKKLGEPLENHRMQMLNYANASGIEYAGLTDGDRWELYEVFRISALDDRRILEVSINGHATHACALQLLLLWRSNLASGRPAAANEPILSIESKRTPILDQLEDEQPPSPPAPTSSLQDGWLSLASLTRQTGSKPPGAIRFPDGNEHPVTLWRQMPQYTAAWLWGCKLLTRSNIPVESSNKRYIVNITDQHQNANPFNNVVSVTGTPLLMEGNISATAATVNVKKLLTHCGVDPAAVHVQVGQST